MSLINLCLKKSIKRLIEVKNLSSRRDICAFKMRYLNWAFHPPRGRNSNKLIFKISNFKFLPEGSGKMKNTKKKKKKKIVSDFTFPLMLI